MSVQANSLQFGHLTSYFFNKSWYCSLLKCSDTFNPGAFASINLSARNRFLQFLQSSNGSLNLVKWPLAFQTNGFKIMALSKQ